MKLSVSFIRKDTKEHVPINMDKPDGDYLATQKSGKYALYIMSLQVYERADNIICGKYIEVTNLTIRVV